MVRTPAPLLCVTALLCGSGLVSAAGCSDTDPNYGPAGAIANYNPIQGGTPAPAGDSAAPADPKTAFKAVFDATTGCAGCHSPTGAAGTLDAARYSYYGADANASYTIFKQKNFQVAGSIFYTKGAHSGPALNDAQKAAIDAWIKSEAGGGGATDAGGG